MRLRNLILALLFFPAIPLAAQLGGRDPLNQKEIDELREVAQEPDRRLKLMVEFARARLAAIDRLRGEPRLAAGRGNQVHDLLEDFTKLVDEMGDNIDDYLDRKYDLRKALKFVIEGDTEFQPNCGLSRNKARERAPRRAARSATTPSPCRTRPRRSI